MIEFNKKYEDDSAEDEFYTCRVIDGEDDCKGVIIENGDELITSLEKLVFMIDYPLTNPARVVVKNKGGFTRKEFVKTVYNVYRNIYDIEGPYPEQRGMLINRPRSYGKYGIWGHVISDLWLEGAEIDNKGNVNLAIGS